MLGFRNSFFVASFVLLLVADSQSFNTPVAKLLSKTNPRQGGRRWNIVSKPFPESDIIASSFQSVQQSKRRQRISLLDQSEAVSVFDPSVGYGDMTGVKSFDDAWIDAFRQLPQLLSKILNSSQARSAGTILHTKVPMEPRFFTNAITNPQEKGPHSLPVLASSRRGPPGSRAQRGALPRLAAQVARRDAGQAHGQQAPGAPHALLLTAGYSN